MLKNHKWTPVYTNNRRLCLCLFPRPKRSAHDALKEIREHIKQGYWAVYDADLKGYFDSIPHDKLMACLEMRVSDRRVLRLIRLWLKCPVVEPPDHCGGKPRVSRPEKGTPQGGVISPLLAIVDLSVKGQKLDFLGYTFRYDKDLHGRGNRYLNVFPSDKALARERDRLREMTSSKMCFKPLSNMITTPAIKYRASG
jgi:retron-type reverse transcriptase